MVTVQNRTGRLRHPTHRELARTVCRRVGISAFACDRGRTDDAPAASLFDHCLRSILVAEHDAFNVYFEGLVPNVSRGYSNRFR